MDESRADSGAAEPASFAQQRLWFMERFGQGGSARAVTLNLRLTGELRVGDLHAALADLVTRHEALRTVFRQAGDELEQLVRAPGPLPLDRIDLPEDPGGDAGQALRTVLRARAAEPFDLSSGPLLRAALIRCGAQDHVLALTMHHVAVDGRSLAILREELADGYNARVRGLPVDPPSPALTYREYARLQHERAAGPAREAGLVHWREQLAGAGALDLPVDRPYPAEPSDAGGYLTRRLDTELVAGLEQFAQEQDSTLYQVLIAAVCVLLKRSTGDSDISLGTTAPGRDHPAASGVVGPFANTVVRRVSLADTGSGDGTPTFRTLVEQVRASAVRSAPYEAVPFDAVVRELRPERGSDRNPLFQVYVGADDAPARARAFDGLTATPLAHDVTTAQFDLSFGLHAVPGGAVLDAGYSADLFDPATVERMLGHLSTLLTAVVVDPDSPVSRVPMLTAPELTAVLDEWNRTERVYPEDSGLHDLFLASAARHGEATAVVCGDESLTYAELAERSARAAAALVRAGVRAGDIVGLCRRRSVDQAVAVLGILRAGAAFLPLDPDYPARRLAHIVADSRCRLVVTAEEFGSLFDASVTLLPAESLDQAGPLVTLPAVNPDDAAYVIYTSGSTGEPKGIVLRHRGAVNNFTDFNDRFGIGPGDGVLSVSSPSFDMSVFDLLGILAAGGTVVFPRPEEVREPVRWVELVRRHRLTVWHSAPALMELLLDAVGDPEALGSLRLALLGGDWIPVGMPDRLRASAPECAFISLGGATEASMDSLLYPVTEVDPAWVSIPYGRPMANQRAYILDEALEPVPVGVRGELHLAGTGLALGYLHRPELTAERFVTHTFADGRTERLYKTGDLARYRADGVIELLGRLDFQVKVHGLRIETGEIEALLRRHRAVRDAVVVAQGDRGHLTLAAVVVADHPHQPVPADLREWLAQSLPASMVPAQVLLTDRLPTTPNGKVDRRALTQLAEQQTLTAAEDDQIPCTDAELRVAAAWSKVLDFDGIGLDDNFFDLGGDSFTAVRAVFEIDRALPVIELFKNPSVRMLARQLGSIGAPLDLLQPLRTETDPDAPALVCLPYGGGSGIVFRDLAARMPEGMPVWGVSLPGHDPNSLDAEPLSFDDAVLRCADEIEERVTGPVALYGHCAGTWMTVALARELEDRGIDLTAVLVGAALPHPDPEESIAAEAVTSDEAWAEVLRSMGGLDGPLDWASLDHIMKIGREDHIGSMRFQALSRRFPPEPIEAPLTCVFGGADASSDGYETQYLGWSPYAHELRLASIPDGGHYFVRTHAAELAEVIVGVLDSTEHLAQASVS
ncbi:amino acid adenylation domain-containing protein [Streptomyces sp. NBC_00338]|uniref:non-ribosomal peptide synthetase n=1 Tax=Streptomyces sp. NBC_00338 TaxID=2975715 RepID=UPI00225B09DD|nr:amino acid adenylation domain-containing protein [Streptomyces sp. NBC_00338]MCX5141820.1 amino acid adenylation domain-containing protein [Streptomyces sp. NBC_00338]